MGNGLYRIIKKLGRQVGVETRRHGIRHTAVTQCCKAAAAANLDLSDPGPLFYGTDKGGSLKGALTRNGLCDLITTVGRKIGRNTRVHGIRHTAITQAVRAASAASLDLSKVMRFSRHSSLNVLEIYLDNERNYQGHIACLVAVGLGG